MIAHIVIGKYIPKNLNGYIVGVDYSAYNLIKNNIKIDVAIGDFDSCTNEEIDIIKQNTKFIQHPCIKDESDLELALVYLKDRFNKIYVHNIFAGNRLDHLITNIQLLIKYNICMIDDNNLAYLLEDGSHKIEKKKYQFISFYPISVNDLTLKGFKYNVENIKPSFMDTYFISNEIVGNAEVVLDGKILVIESND